MWDVGGWQKRFVRGRAMSLSESHLKARFTHKDSHTERVAKPIQLEGRSISANKNEFVQLTRQP